MGPSIKYVTLFLANFYPPPPVTLRHTSRDPPESTSHISDLPPISRRPSTKNPDKSPPCTNSVSIVRGGFCPGVLSGGLTIVWKVLSGVIFVRSHSVRIQLFHQKVKHHFKFHVLYV